MSDYPRTDDAELEAYDDGLPDGSVSKYFAQRLEDELAEANAKLAFLQQKGLTVGMMESSDKPEPYLAYVIDPGSELCDLATVNKLIDAEVKVAKLESELADTSEMLQWCLHFGLARTLGVLSDEYHKIMVPLIQSAIKRGNKPAPTNQTTTDETR